MKMDFLHLQLMIFSCTAAFLGCSCAKIPDWCSAIDPTLSQKYPQCQAVATSSSTAPSLDRPDDWKSYLVNSDQDSDRLGEASSHFFEGDILNFDMALLNSSTGEESTKMMSNAVRDPKLKWERGIIPFVISGKIPPKNQKIIRQAMDTFHRKTCIRFKQRTSETDYVSIESNEGCNSYIGKIGGMQPISLQIGQCFKAGKVEHELMHAVGFTHEQSRTDRDQYVMINWDNIANDAKLNFQSYSADRIDSLGAPYDYGSIMHYGPFYFAVNSDMWTILPREKGKEIGQRRTMSDTDVWKINKMYNCPQSRRGGDRGRSTPKPPNIPECPPGWSNNAGTCLYFSKENAREPMSWTDARNVCEAQLATLVSVEDEEANKVITDKFKDIVERIWISASINSEKYHWATAGGTKEVFYSNWADLEPKNCVTLNREGKWESNSCDATFDFICERPLRSLIAAEDAVKSMETTPPVQTTPPSMTKRRIQPPSKDEKDQQSNEETDFSSQINIDQVN